MKTLTIFFNAMIIMILGIGIVVGGLTGSALAHNRFNQTNAEQGKNNTDSGSPSINGQSLVY